MPKSIRGIIRLTRHTEYVATVIATTLIGVVFTGLHLDTAGIVRLLLVLIANFLAVCFSFMINDIEDAADDAASNAKAKRNPISAGVLTPRLGYFASFGVAALAIFIYWTLGTIPFWLGLASLILGGLYSWKTVRLKRIPIVDLASHGLMLAGLQFACTYFAFVPYTGLHITWVAPLILVISISVYGELFNEVRDLEGDRKVGITHTVAMIGEKKARLLMNLLIALEGGTIVYGIISGLIPLWFIILVASLVTLFYANQRIGIISRPSGKHHTDISQSVLMIGILSLLAWLALRMI